MDKSTAQIVAQARSLRALCAELAHGAAREAFVARVDEELAALAEERLRLVVVSLDGASAEPAAELVHELAGVPIDDAMALVALTMPAGGDAAAGGLRVLRALPAEALAKGFGAIHLVLDPERVFASPVLLGRVVDQCDVVAIVGTGASASDATISGLRRLGDAGRHALRLGAADPDLLAPRLAEAFRTVRTCTREPGDATWLAAFARVLPAAERVTALCDGALSRLAMCADLLGKQVQSEFALLKFRVTDVTRLRRGEDLAMDAAGDAREQAELIKSTLQAWTASCREDLVRMGEQGILPFDPRLLANKVEAHDLLQREERSAAVIKYPVLGSVVFRGMVTHTYTVLPDPAAVERMRESLVTALAAQANKDVKVLNQRAGELLQRLEASASLYPLFAPALGSVRLPVLGMGAIDRTISNVTLETEAEDKFVRLGFFKRLMEGRMVASMAFSFLTMSAGVFVLFGEPNIKRGLMKFSGVIVIMMVLYFIFSMLVKGEEEKQELDEVLERVRGKLNQDVGRPLMRAQTVLLKAYGQFVDEVAASVMQIIESVARTKTGERARVMEARKNEDELVKAFAARRQAAASAAATKVAAFVTGVERARTVPCVCRPDLLR